MLIKIPTTKFAAACRVLTRDGNSCTVVYVGKTVATLDLTLGQRLKLESAGIKPQP